MEGNCIPHYLSALPSNGYFGEPAMLENTEVTLN